MNLRIKYVLTHLTILDKELRIVLIGKTGVGKSASANTIIGENYFKSEFGGASVTQVCTEKHAKTHGKQILVVDTPGIFDTDTDPKDLETEIRKCINIAAPGPHAVLFVMRLNDRYKKEDYEALKIFLSYFGEEMLDYVIVVFTFADIIQAKRISLDEYLENSPPKLRELLKLFDDRRIPFNNEIEGIQRDLQVQGLLTMIEGLKIANAKASYYNDHNFEYAESRIKKKEREIEERVKQDYVIKKKEDIKNLTQKHNKHMLEVRQQYENELSQLRQTVRGQTSILVKGFQLKLVNIKCPTIFKILRRHHFIIRRKFITLSVLCMAIFVDFLYIFF